MSLYNQKSGRRVNAQLATEDGAHPQRRQCKSTVRVAKRAREVIGTTAEAAGRRGDALGHWRRGEAATPLVAEVGRRGIMALQTQKGGMNGNCDSATARTPFEELRIGCGSCTADEGGDRRHGRSQPVELIGVRVWQQNYRTDGWRNNRSPVVNESGTGISIHTVDDETTVRRTTEAE
jgi:hypothetical protein